jgi:hypothetical protein
MLEQALVQKRRAVAQPARTLLSTSKRIAEAQVDLLRVRYARLRLLLEELSNPDYRSRKKLTAVVRFARAFGADTSVPADMIEFLDSKPEAHSKRQRSCRITLVSSKLSTVMSGAPGRSLQSERLM